jgi:hypothetical protein
MNQQNKQVILQALQTQLATVKNACIEHEKTVYEPAIDRLNDKIMQWFSEHVIADLHSISIGSDSIVIKPFDTTRYGNDITIDSRSRYGSVDGGYYEVSSYRFDIDSREDNSQSVKYYNAMASIATEFANICSEYKAKWQPQIKKLLSKKEAMYNEIYKLEREIRNCESEIAELEKDVYNRSGAECTLKPNTNYAKNDAGEYVMVSRPHTIRAQYGRSRWDYNSINSFVVVSFPKTKHGKVVLDFKGGDIIDGKTHRVEMNRARYAEFISSVHAWQTREADERVEYVQEKIQRWSATTV